MLTDQIKALEDNLEVESMILVEAEDNIKEIKKRITLNKAALKSLRNLEGKLEG